MRRDPQGLCEKAEARLDREWVLMQGSVGRHGPSPGSRGGGSRRRLVLNHESPQSPAPPKVLITPTALSPKALAVSVWGRDRELTTSADR